MQPSPLVTDGKVTHKRDVSHLLFDDHARILRRDRATRLHGDLFLHARAFDDILDRLADIRSEFATALIDGRSESSWRDSLALIVPQVVLADPASVAPQSFDLCLSIGELDADNDVQAAASALRRLLRPGGLLIGAIVGGNSLPLLRGAMLAADRAEGRGTAPRLHPSIDGPSLAKLLTSVGFIEPVIDVDRVDVAYPDLDRLVGDLRAMGCTNVLSGRSRRPITRRGLGAARIEFDRGKGPSIERFELLHFAAWSPKFNCGNPILNPVSGIVS